MPFPNYQYEIIKMYLAAFIRAPEKSGLEYWLAQLNSGKSFESMLDTVFSLDIVKVIYPEGLPNASFVTLIYVNVFGKSPDPEGLAYWTQQLVNGRSHGGLVMDMINAGLTTPDGTLGKAYIVNRLAAAQAAVDQQYVQKADLSPTYLKSVMASVNADPVTVTNAIKAVGSTVSGVGIGTPVNSLVVPAAANGISASEVKAGIAVTIDLTGTNAVINNTVELLMDRLPFSTPISKVLTDVDVKAQKVTLTIPNTINWGSDGTKVLSAYVRDSNGVQGIPGGDLAIDVNTLPPNLPTNPIYVDAAVNGINAQERASGIVARVDLKGTQANVGDKVEVLLAGQVFSATANVILLDADVNAGFVNVTISGAADWGADGNKTLGVRITDVAGNVSGVGGTLVVTLDTVAPTPISSPVVIAAASGGIGPVEKAVNINVVASLVGSNAQAGDSIELLIDGVLFKNSTLHTLTVAEVLAKSVTLSIAANDTGWNLPDGVHTISTHILDTAGNTSPIGGAAQVTLDSIPPNSQNALLTIAAAQNGLSASEVAAGVSVVVNLTSTNANAGDIVNFLIDGQPLVSGSNFTLNANQITGKSATFIIPASANWGADGAKSLSLTITDAAGNIGTPSGVLSVIVDRTVPAAATNPLVIPVAANGLNNAEKLAGVNVLVDLTGTNAAAGDKIELTLDGASFPVPVYQVLTVTDIANGNLNAIIPNTANWGADGSKNIAVRVIDSSGNVGASGAAFNLTLDTVAPAGPTNALVVAANAGGGINPAERAAGVAVLIDLNGTTAVAGDTVEILIGGLAFTTPVKHVLTPSEIALKTATATIGTTDGWGPDGIKTLTARFVDTAGNLGTATATVSVNLDGTAPNAPGGSLTIAAASNGVNNAEKVAGVVVQVDLTGTGALAGDTVNILLNGVPFTTPVTQVLSPAHITGNQVSITIPSGAGWGADGNKTLTATIVDSVGNTSAQGASTTFALDTTAPTAASNPVVIAAATNGINTNEKTAGVNVLIDLTGTAAVAGDKIEVLIGGVPFGTPVTQVLTSLDIVGQTTNVLIPSGAGWGGDGTKAISVRVTDVSGNVGAAGGSASVTLDTTAPAAPAITLIVPANGGGGISAAEKAAGVAVTVSLSASGVVAGDSVEILLGGSSFPVLLTHVLTSGEVLANSVTLTINPSNGWGADGAKTLTAQFTDIAGNIGAAGGSLGVTMQDTTAPNAPSVALSVPAAASSINLNEKNAGVSVTASLLNTNAVAGDTANIFIDGTAFSTPVTHVLTGAEVLAGSFTISIASSAGWGADGSHILTMGVTDIAGNIGATGGAFTLNLDTIAPTAPTNALVAAAAGNGINSAEKTAGVITTVDLTGTGAVAGDKIEILLGGASFTNPIFHVLTSGEVLAGSANATIDVAAGWGADGVKTISARVIDMAGNVGAAGGSLTTFIDSVLPSASGLPVYVDTDTSSTINVGDTYKFTISEATNKAIGIGNVTVNHSHTLGTGASVSWSADGTQLTLILGTGADIVVGDTITLVGVSDLAGNTLNLAFAI